MTEDVTVPAIHPDHQSFTPPFFFPGGNVNRGKARRTSCCETFPLFTACYTIHSSHSIKPAVLMCYGSKLVTNSTIGNLNILNVYHIIRKCPPSLSVRNKEIESFVILNCPSVAMNQSTILLWRASMHKNAGKIREGLNYTPHPVGIVSAQDSTFDLCLSRAPLYTPPPNPSKSLEKDIEIS